MTRLGKIFLAFIIVSSSLFMMRAYLTNSFPYTHDGENHLARFANYKLAVKEGQFPPRLAPNLLNRYGYPVFNYNYPLANILSLPFSALKIEYESTFKILIFLSLVVGGIGVYQVTGTFFPHSILSTHVFVLLVWYTQTYLQNLLLFRGTIGEIMAIALLPHLLNMIFLVKKEYSLTNFIYGYIVSTAFLLSHNISVLFGSIIFSVLSLYIFKKNKKFWLRLLLYIVPALGSTLWFWLPALMEKNQIILDGVNLFSQVLLHLLSWSQLLFAPLDFGFSLEGPVDSLGFSLNLVTILMLLLATVFVMFDQNKKKTVHFYLMLSFLLIFLQTSQSEIIWKAIPVLGYVQFPWRLALFLSVTLIPISAYVWKASSQIFRKVLILAILSTVYSLSQLKPVDFFHKNTVDYDAFSQTTSTQNENLPKTFTYTGIADWQPSATIINGEGDIQVQYWTGSKREYTVSATTPVTVVEPTAYFLGWETRVENNVNLEKSDSKLTEKKSMIRYIDSDSIQGRIAYVLEPGSYHIKSEFTQNTWPRIVGNLISITSVLFMVIVILRDVFQLGTIRNQRDFMSISKDETY